MGLFWVLIVVGVFIAMAVSVVVMSTTYSNKKRKQEQDYWDAQKQREIDSQLHAQSLKAEREEKRKKQIAAAREHRNKVNSKIRAESMF